MKASGIFHTSEPDGPYKLGVRIEMLELMGREMRMVVWYPAVYMEGTEPHVFKNGVRGSAVLDASPDRSGAPYPLVVFSAGLLGGGDAAVFFTQNIASFGYVVIGLDHLDARQRTPILREWSRKNVARYLPRMVGELLKGDNSSLMPLLFEKHFEETQFGLTYRPQEVTFAIDMVTNWSMDNSSFLYNMTDSVNVGLAGHSLGGFISLLLAGMPFHRGDLRHMYSRGQRTSGIDIYYHSSPAECSASEDEFEFRDPRVKAVLALAPPIFHEDIAGSAARLETPLMILAGDSRYLEAYFPNMRLLYENAGGPAYFVLIRQTDHFVINDAILAMPRARYLFRPVFQRHFPEKARAYKDYSAAFFNLYLKGDDAKAGILQAPNQAYVKQLWYEGRKT